MRVQKRNKKLPVAAIVITRGIRPIPRISSIARRQVSRGRTVVGWTAIHVGVWGRVVTPVWVVVSASRRRVVINGAAARR